MSCRADTRVLIDVYLARSQHPVILAFRAGCITDFFESELAGALNFYGFGSAAGWDTPELKLGGIENHFLCILIEFSSVGLHARFRVAKLHIPIHGKDAGLAVKVGAVGTQDTVAAAQGNVVTEAGIAVELEFRFTAENFQFAIANCRWWQLQRRRRSDLTTAPVGNCTRRHVVIGVRIFGLTGRTVVFTGIFRDGNAILTPGRRQAQDES